MLAHCRTSILWGWLAGLLCQTCFAQKPELVLETGHSERVLAVAFSSNGRTLASSDIAGTIKLWDLSSGRELRTLLGHSAAVTSVAFSPDGLILASGGADRSVRLWETSSGRDLQTLTAASPEGSGEPASIAALSFSPDGRVVASAGDGNTISIWDVHSSQAPRRLTGHTDRVMCVAFSPDGRMLASASKDNTIRLWNLASGQELRTLTKQNSTDLSVSPLEFSPDGRILASGSSGLDDSISLWDVSSGLKVRSLSGHSQVVYAAKFSRDGRTLTSGSWDNTVKVWDVTRGSALETRKGPVAPAVFSSDGQILASADNAAVRLWDVAHSKPSRSLVGTTQMVLSVAFSRDGRTLVCGSQDRTIKVWDLANDRALRVLAADSKGIDSVVRLSPDGRLLAAGSGNSIRLWDLASQRELTSLLGHTKGIHSLAFSQSGRILASASYDKTTKLWDVASGRELKTIPGEVTSMALSPDGRRVASGSRFGTVMLWDVDSGSEMRRLAGHAGAVYAIAFSPSGRTLASGANDHAVKLWDVSTGREILTLAGHTDVVFSTAFSPDGQTLATGSWDHTVRLWDVASGRELKKLAAHSGAVLSVTFSPDGRVIASGDYTGAVVLSDVASGSSLARLVALPTRVWDVASRQPAETLVSMRDSADWLVVTPDGLFDGSPEAWNQILWRFNNNTFDVAPVEIFFREYYYPGLLADIFAGKHPKATTDLANIDRRQPAVVIERDDQSPANPVVESRTVKLRLQVSEVPPDAEREGGSGARDVRLFRNGALVKVWRGDLKLDPQGHARLEAKIPVVAGENKLTAYVFSKSDIKSSDAQLTVTGAESLRRGGIGYILAVGVDEYANKKFNLKYAVGDVQEFASVFSEQQRKLQNYAALKTTYLLNSDATKANLLAALERSAGASADKLTPAQQKLFADLAPAQPEDGVFIYYAGHGYAHGQRFYLLPHDMVMPERGEDFAKPEAHSVSDLELGDVFEKIGAGRSLFLIDACRSGQALEAEEKRRGPMNSKGLAQLAYEKGMYILTASQSYQSALESAELGGGHGFLTYALVEKGLKTQDAAVDGQVELRHWLDYATQVVPQLQLASMQEAQKQGRRLVVVSGEEEEAASPEQRSLQRPRVFYRREAEAQPFIVARP